MRRFSSSPLKISYWLLLLAFTITAAVYWPGMYGGFLFDDYPNIVDNPGVQPSTASLSSLTRAALSSPASDFKRPLASLSFAANYLATGLDPFWMKLTNLIIHLLNGLLVFFLAKALLMTEGLYGIRQIRGSSKHLLRGGSLAKVDSSLSQDIRGTDNARTNASATDLFRRAGIIAALVSGGWLLLPINLTGVLYIVQRMESMANALVLLGLIGYVSARWQMLGISRFNLSAPTSSNISKRRSVSAYTASLALCWISIIVPVLVGALAKETAVMLPLYALAIEWILFRFNSAPFNGDLGGYLAESCTKDPPIPSDGKLHRDWRILTLFGVLLVLPMIAGLAWLAPGILRPETWAARDFTLTTRLLSEARIISGYIVWTLIPTPHSLSFYHDDFHISTGLLTPWTTLVGVIVLFALCALMIWLRNRRPIAALGLAFFLTCQLLTGTILPLELIYEHRNYFASFGLLLAVVPLLAAPASAKEATPLWMRALPLALPRYVLLAGLMLCWTALTALTAYAWGNPLRLAEDLAARAPDSPRAEYELGRTYIIYSHYDPSSPFTKMAYAPLERAATLPDSSILPEQALIFMNARMHLPLKDAWWTSLNGKLEAHKPGVQDESSLGALTQCDREHRCELPKKRMTDAFLAAMAHPEPDARLLAMYGDYAWNVLDDRELGLRMTEDAVEASPNEPAYQITLIRMLVVQGRKAEANKALQKLRSLNIGGRLNNSLGELRALLGTQQVNR